MKTNLFTSLRLLKAKLIVTLFVYLAATNIVGAQTQNNIWSLPPKYYNHSASVTYDLPIPTGSVPKYAGQSAKHTQNAMQDAQGNLLFFIVDDRIYDKEGYLIDTLNYGDPVKGSAEICIIPDPGNCQRYYI